MGGFFEVCTMTIYFWTWLFVRQQVGMVEFQGLLKVRVIKGAYLAVRDLKTSDPYVVISVGHQVSFF